MKASKKIVINPESIGGQPQFEGTRIAIYHIVHECKEGGIENYLSDFEEFDLEHIRIAAEYCKSRQCDVDDSHCANCSLGDIENGILTLEDFLTQHSEVFFWETGETIKGTGEGQIVLSGKAKDLPNLWQGEDGWLYAEKVLKELDKIENK